MPFAGEFLTEETEDTESLTLVKLKSCIYGCLKNSDLETSDLRSQTSKLETSDLVNSDLETSDPLKND